MEVYAVSWPTPKGERQTVHRFGEECARATVDVVRAHGKPVELAFFDGRSFVRLEADNG